MRDAVRAFYKVLEGLGVGLEGSWSCWKFRVSGKVAGLALNGTGKGTDER